MSKCILHHVGRDWKDNSNNGVIHHLLHHKPLCDEVLKCCKCFFDRFSMAFVTFLIFRSRTTTFTLSSTYSAILWALLCQAWYFLWHATIFSLSMAPPLFTPSLLSLSLVLPMTPINQHILDLKVTKKITNKTSSEGIDLLPYETTFPSKHRVQMSYTLLPNLNFKWPTLCTCWCHLFQLRFLRYLHVN